MSKSEVLRLALIVGSTRPNRNADILVRWTVAGAAARSDFTLDVLDLRDWPLPFYEEPVTPNISGGVYTNPVAERWRHVIGEYDGYIATAPEYNHGPTAVLKNALDSAWLEWQRKPISFVGYGGLGGARAVEQLRMHAVELHMTPIQGAVHVSREPLIGVLMHGKSLDDHPYLAESRTVMFDQMVWWGRALKAARDAAPAAVEADLDQDVTASA